MANKSVYLVSIFHAYEGSTVEGVFADKESADEFAKELSLKYKMKVWESNKDGSIDHILVEDFKLQTRKKTKETLCK